jgi:hypothetical protein
MGIITYESLIHLDLFLKIIIIVSLFQFMKLILLEVKKGSVTPLALLNDKNNKVNVILDSKMIDSDDNILLFHPLTCDKTLPITAKQLLLFIEATGHKYEKITF